MQFLKWSAKLWKEGTYVDFWSINHFLFGIFLGVVATHFIPVSIGLPLCLAAAIAWEFFERKIGHRERIKNRVSDVIVTVLGFGVAVIAGLSLETTGVLGVLAALYVVFGVWGYSVKFYARSH